MHERNNQINNREINQLMGCVFELKRVSAHMYFI